MKKTAALALVIVAACQKPAANDPAAEQAHSDSVKAAIEAMAPRYAAHFIAGNVDSLVAFHAPNATMMPPNMAATSGTDAIRQSYTGIFAGGKPTVFTLRVEAVSVHGPLAVERGRYVFTGPVAPGVVATDSGKYLNHWHEVGGRWLIVDEIWNSDLPPPPMPPEPRRRS